MQARVTIVDTTESGVVQFPHTHISVVCTKDRVQVPVIRKGGCNGAATITYATQTDTAASGVLPDHPFSSRAFAFFVEKMIRMSAEECKQT